MKMKKIISFISVLSFSILISFILISCNKHNHTYGVWEVTIKPTDITQGEISRTCTTDGYVETDVLPILTDSSYIVNTVNPTCTTKGSKTYKYSKDSQELSIVVEIDALGHNYDDFVVMKEPTEDEVGSKSHTCSVCGYVETLDIDMLDHTHKYGEWSVTVVPTETTSGEISRTCSKDGNVETYILPKLNETDYEYSSSETTCSKIETYKYNISNQSFEYEVETIINGHNYSLTSLIVEETDIDFCGEFKCSICSKVKYDSITYEDINMPILNISGSLDGISKENKININTSYYSEGITFNTSATLKYQGSSSLGYPKKNFNIQFLNEKGKKNKIKLVDSWGKQSKYTLKANYIDYSQARNVVSAKIFGDVLHSRNIEDELNSLVNGGAIDGYPILMYINGEYQGLYTLNIPKDKWLFNMDDSDTLKEAMLFGNDWTNSVALYEHVAADFSNGWELEFCSTEDEALGTSWVVDSFNNFIDFINNTTDQEFIENINSYTSLSRVIDVMIYTNLTCAMDNTSKNLLWVTYDGIKYIPSLYDMDDTYGLIWDGNDYYGYNAGIGSNALYDRIWSLFKEDVVNRYNELRNTIYTKDYIVNKFETFFNSISSIVRVADDLKWTLVPSQDTNNINQISQWIEKRLEYLDTYYVI